MNLFDYGMGLLLVGLGFVSVSAGIATFVMTVVWAKDMLKEQEK